MIALPHRGARCERIPYFKQTQIGRIGAGLVFGYMHRPSSPYDEVTGTNGVPTNIAQTTDVRYPGTGFAGGGDLNSTVNFGQFVGTQDLNESPATWAFFCLWNAGANNFAPACHSDANVKFGWQVGEDTFSGNSGMGLTLVRGTTNLRALTSPTNIPVNAPFTFVVTHDGSNTAANVTIYVNAVVQTHGIASVNGVGATGGPATTESLYLGRGRMPGGHSHGGRIYVALIAPRIWSAADVAAFHGNPYAPLTRPRMLPWLPVG